MSKQMSPKARSRITGVPGYGRGIWWLAAASAVLLFVLFTLETSRALPGGLGWVRQVEVERIPAEEARNLGISPRKR